MQDSPPASPKTVILEAAVLANRVLCDEHLCLTFGVEDFPAAKPGQFVHVGPTGGAAGVGLESPFLRRAFSIAGLRRIRSAVEIDVIYRVVGKGTRWMGALRQSDRVSLLGPQGKAFPIESAPTAWLVAGGVGLPPLLWLAEALRQAGKEVVFFYGAQRMTLAALELGLGVPASADACTATLSATRLAKVGVPVVLSTDDGSLGFRGHVGQALEAFAAANSPAPDGVVLYTCGPERMMHFVAGFAARRNLRAYACVERSMACATGMCQSCVVPLKDAADADGWRYRLCCTDGPVFDTADIIWDMPAFLASH